MAQRGKIKHSVESDLDGVVYVVGTIGMSGSASAAGVPQALSCSVVFSTLGQEASQPLDGQTTARPATSAWTGGMLMVSGTSPGTVTLTFDQQFSYPRMIGWGADLRAGSTSSLNWGGPNGTTTKVRHYYDLQKVAYQYPYGAQVPSSSASPLYVNPTAGGGAVMQFQVMNLQVMVTGNVAAGNITQISGTAVDPVDASVASGSATANISFWAAFRKKGRSTGW